HEQEHRVLECSGLRRPSETRAAYVSGALGLLDATFRYSAKTGTGGIGISGVVATRPHQRARGADEPVLPTPGHHGSMTEPRSSAWLSARIESVRAAASARSAVARAPSR